MQPIPLYEQVQLYKPNRLPEASRTVQVGAVQGVNVQKSQAAQMQAAMAGDSFYLRVVRELKTGFGALEDNEKVTLNGTTSSLDEMGDSMDLDTEHQPVNMPRNLSIP